MAVALAVGWFAVGVADAQGDPSTQQAPPSAGDPAPTTTIPTGSVPTTSTTIVDDEPDEGDEAPEPGSDPDPGDGDDEGEDESDAQTDDRPQSTTTTTAPRVDREPSDESDSDSTSGSEDGGGSQPNPLLVAGPSDGRRQITSDTTLADEGVDDAPTVTEPADPEVTDDAEEKVRRVVWGLIGLAVVLTVLALYYWWITRPEPLPVDEPSEKSDGEGTVDPWLTDSTSTR